MNIDDKIKYLRKHFKRNKNIFELILIKYESINYYIRVDYNPSLKAYYLYSCDLDYLDKKKDKYINRQFIKAEALNYVLDIYDTIQYESFEDLKYTTDIVELNINDKTFKFNRYIPVKYYDLCACTLLAGLFMPARLTTVFDELVAEINGVSYRYDYKKEFKFDIYKTDLDRIFSFDIINQAEEVLKNDKIKFLEKFESGYLGFVEGHDNYAYVIQVIYNKETHMTRIVTTCECVGYCKHMCAVLMAIRENKLKNFYKIRMIRKNEDALERLLDISNSLLCIGGFDNQIQVLDDRFNFVNVPIINEVGDKNFEIIGDNDNELQEFVDKVIRGDKSE